MPRNPKATPEASAAGRVLGQHSQRSNANGARAIQAEAKVRALKDLATRNGVDKALEIMAQLYAKAQEDLDAKLPQPGVTARDAMNGSHPSAPAGIAGHKAHYAVQTEGEDGPDATVERNHDATAGTSNTASLRHGAGGSDDVVSRITQGYPTNPFRENPQEDSYRPVIVDRREVTPVEAWDKLNEGLALLAKDEPQREDESNHDYAYRQIRRYQRSLELYNWYYRANREVDKSAQTIMVLLKHAKDMYIGGIGRGGRPQPPIMADALMQAHENEASEMSDEELAKAMEEKEKD